MSTEPKTNTNSKEHEFLANERLSQTVHKNDNVVTFDVGENGKMYKLSMRYVPSSTLDIIRSVNPDTEED